MCLNSTLLPDPLGPISTNISPGATLSEKSLSTFNLLKLFDKCSIETPTALFSRNPTDSPELENWVKTKMTKK